MLEPSSTHNLSFESNISINVYHVKVGCKGYTFKWASLHVILMKRAINIIDVNKSCRRTA